MDTETVTLLVGIVSTAGALIGVAMGSAFTYFATHRQFRATVIVNRRQSWIDSFSNAVAEFEGLLLVFQELADHDDIARDEWLPAFRRATFLFAKIGLLLNPLDEKHNMVVASIDRALQTVSAAKDTSSEEVRQIHASIKTNAQQVLNAEWTHIEERI